MAKKKYHFINIDGKLYVLASDVEAMLDRMGFGKEEHATVKRNDKRKQPHK